jgi:hypothetical protein
MKVINARCEIIKEEFTVTFNQETSWYETIVNLKGDVKIFNIRSIQFIDNVAIIDGQALCVDEVGVGIIIGIIEKEE